MTNNIGADDRIVEILATLGKTYLQKREYDKAIEKYEQLLSLSAGEGTIFRDLSKAYLAIGRRDKKALSIYEKAFPHDSSNTELIQTLAEFYIQSGRDDDAAMIIYRKLLNFQPDNRRVLLKLVNNYIKQGNFDTAKNLCQKVIDQGFGAPEILTYFLRICYHDGDYDLVIDTLEKVVAKSNDRNFLLALGRTYLRKELVSSVQKIPFRLSERGIRHCISLLNSIKTFRTLEEIILLLDLKRLLKIIAGSPGNLDPTVVNILNQLSIEYNDCCKFNYYSDFIEKFDVSVSSPEFFPSNDFHEVDQLNQSKLPELSVLAIIQFSNFSELSAKFGQKITGKIARTFNSICSIQLRKNKFQYIWQTEDAVLVFTNEVRELINTIIEILRKLEKYNTVVNEKEHIYLQIGLDRSPMNVASDDRIISELYFALQFYRANKFESVDKVKTTEPSKCNRILCTSSVYQKLNEIQKYPVLCVGALKSRDLPNGKLIYELVWRNPLESLERGVTRKLGRFEILDELNKHYQVVTYRAKDVPLSRLVVVKAISFNPELTTTERAEAKDKFIKEARLLSRLGHPNIVITYDVGDDADFLYLAREYIEGENFLQWLDNNEDIDIRQFLTVCINICRGINYAHRSGIIHGNLGPGNIFVTEAGDVKVSDFGITMIQQKIFKYVKFNKDHLKYISPEQLEENIIDGRSDIFSMATVMYEALTRKMPFYFDHAIGTSTVFSNTPPAPSSLNEMVPQFVDNILLKALKKRPIDRQQNISEFIREIQNVLKSKIVTLDARN